MPFLDTLERKDFEILEILRYSSEDATGASWIVSHPKLAGGIHDDQRATVALLALEWQDPESAKILWALPWIRDGIASSEQSVVLELYEMARFARGLFQVLTARTWLRDSLTADEEAVIRDLAGMADKRNARRDETSAIRIARMPFLNSVSRTDAAAVNSLAGLWIARGPTDYLQDVLSHPRFWGGVRDEQAALVAVLGTVARRTPELLDGLLASGQDFVWQRTLRLPNSSDVDLIVASPSRRASRDLDLLEHAMRSHIAFMGLPFPTSYVTLWVHNEGSGGGGASGRLDSGSYNNPSTVAHEAAHVYWPFGPLWIAEGVAVLLEKISENARIGSPVEPITTQGYLVECAAETISELERLARIADQGICTYVLGSGLFVELYHALGDRWSREGFRRLHQKLHNRQHEFECQGQERGVCYVRAAFVTDAHPHAAAAADRIINRWYYGSEHGPQ